MQTKKKKALVWALLAVVVIGAGASYAGFRFWSKWRAEGWRREGEAAANAGDHARAAELLGRYVRRYPDRESALSLFVKSRELAELPNGQHLTDTLWALRQLLGIDPNRYQDREHMLEIYARLNRWPETLDAAKPIEEKLRLIEEKNKDLHEQYVRVLELQVRALRGLHEERAALDVAKNWHEKSPEDLKAQMAWLSLRVAVGYPVSEIIKDAEPDDSHKNNPTSELLAGFACVEAYANSPQSDENHNTYRERAQYWLRAAAKHPVLSEDFVKSLVEQFDRLGMSEEALDALSAAKGSGPEIRYELARRLWQRGEWQRGAWQAVIDNLGDVDPSNPRTDATLVAIKAMALHKLKQSDEAASCHAALSARKQQAAARAWALLLRRLIDREAVDDRQVSAECRAALQLDPRNSYLLYYLGEAEQRLGEADLAVQAWWIAMLNNPSWTKPAIRLVEGLLQKGQLDEALAIAGTVAQRNPNDPEAAIIAARAWAVAVEAGFAGREDDLLASVTKIQNYFPGEQQTQLIQIQMLAREGKTNKAIDTARAALSKTPQPTEREFLALASLSRAFKMGLEQECFAASQRAYGMTPGLAFARAMERAAPDGGNNAAEGLRVFDEQASSAGTSDAIAWRLARAQYLDAVHDPGARSAWVALGDAFPNELRVQQAVASAWAMRGDWDFMPRTIERLRALMGESGLAWRLTKARLMVEAARNASDVEQGSVLLNEILKQHPGVSEARMLLAQALVQMNRTDGAIEQLAEIEPRSAPVRLQLVRLLQSRGKYDQVRQELKTAPYLHTPAQRRQAAQLLAAQGDIDLAMNVLQGRASGTAAPTTATVVAPSTRPAADVEADELLLAMLYRQQRRFGEADALVQKLLQASPDVPTIQFAASLYTSLGRIDDAEKALKLLDKAKLEPGVKEILLASHYAQRGNLPEALNHYRAAVREAPGNAIVWRMLVGGQVAQRRLDDAKSTLDEALRAAPQDKGLVVISRHWPLLRRAAGTNTLAPLASAVIRDPLNDEATAATVELIGVMTDALASDDPERVATVLQQFIARHPNFMPAQLLLVQAYASLGRTSDALAAAQHAMTAFPAAAEPARAAVEVSAAAGRWQQAQAAAEVWKKRVASDPMPADLAIARAQIGMRQFEAARHQLEPYIATVKAAPETAPDVLTVYCIAMVASARTAEDVDKIGEMLWPLASGKPAWRPRWIEVGMSAPDAATAEKWLKRLEDLPGIGLAERIAIAEAYDQLAASTSKSAYSAKASALIELVVNDPKVSPVSLLMAGVRAERLKDLIAAEKLYRRALQADPNLWIANNNLAMLLLNSNPGEAVVLASAAARLNPRNADVRDTLAQASSKAGDLKTAVSSMETAVKLEPDNARWRIRLAKYRLEGGQVAEARQVLARLDQDGLRLPEELKGELKDVREKIGGSVRQ